jgi:hypothetical protein
MIKGGIKQLWVSAYDIADEGVKRAPMIAIEQETFFDKERVEVWFGGTCPVIVCG